MTTPHDDETTPGTVRPGTPSRSNAQGESPDVMGLLQQHVPLALLADLAERDGPPSPVILESEGLPERPWWERPKGRQASESTAE